MRRLVSAGLVIENQGPPPVAAHGTSTSKSSSLMSFRLST